MSEGLYNSDSLWFSTKYPDCEQTLEAGVRTDASSRSHELRCCGITLAQSKPSATVVDMIPFGSARRNLLLLLEERADLYPLTIAHT